MESLKKLNSFGLDAYCDKLITIRTETDLDSVIKRRENPVYILGQGSNILLLNNINIPILKNEIKGIKVIAENSNEVHIQVASGENWHQFILYCVQHNYYGLENLSLIPGTIGAAPIQNIGAYGVELKDHLYRVNGIHLSDNSFQSFTNNECQFEYRSSIFKKELLNKFFITSIELKLSKIHKLHIDYGTIKEELHLSNITNPTIKDISDIIIQIRKSKLPDPEIIGNAGSFFKNSVISQKQYDELKIRFPDMPCYKLDNNLVKIPTAWLIEKAGWKGFRRGDAACHTRQSLVLVNHGKSSGLEILQLANDIKSDIFNKFGINIELEVNVWK